VLRRRGSESSAREIGAMTKARVIAKCEMRLGNRSGDIIMPLASPEMTVLLRTI